MKFVIPILLSFFLMSSPTIVQSQESEQLCCGKEDTIKYHSNAFIIADSPKVVINFKTKNISFDSSISNLKRGNAVRVKVVNYNPFLYNVVINSTDSTAYAMNDAGNLLSWFLSPSNLSSIAANLLASPLAAPPTLEFENGHQTLFGAKKTNKIDTTTMVNDFLIMERKKY